MKSNKLTAALLFLVFACVVETSAIAASTEVSANTSGAELTLSDAGKTLSDHDCHRNRWLETCAVCPCAYGYVEGLLLERSNGSFDQPILIQTVNDIPVATALSTSELDFDFEPGVRAVIGRRLQDGWALEGSYLGLFDASASIFVQSPAKDPVAPDPTRFPDGLGSGATNVFSDITRSWVTYSSSLHSAELNLVSCRGYHSTCEHGKGECNSKGDGCGDGLHELTVECFAGFRYLRLSEQLHIYAEADRDPTGGGPVDTESGYYDIRAGNNLYGAQFGARLRRWGDRLGWEATGKAGIFGNDVYQRQLLIDWDNGPFTRRSTSRAGGQAAFVGDLNFTGFYRLTDVWNVRAGYNLIWIAGVALAPDQLDFSGDPLLSGNQLSSNGSVFLHGVSCGLEARW